MSRKSLKLVVASAGLTLALTGGVAPAQAQQSASKSVEQPPTNTIQKVAKKKLPTRGKIRARGDRVTKNSSRWISSSEAYDVAKGLSAMAGYALSACAAPSGAKAIAARASLQYAVRLTPLGRVSATWASGLLTGFQKFSGNDFCDIAMKSANGAAWAAYYGATQSRTWSQIYIWQQDRFMAPDVCHTYIALNERWRVYDLATSTMFSSCPS